MKNRIDVGAALARKLLTAVLLCAAGGALAQLPPPKPPAAADAACAWKETEGRPPAAAPVDRENTVIARRLWPDAMIAACTRIVESAAPAGERADALYARGNWLRSSRKLSGAIEDFSQALHLRPDDPVLLFARGRAWSDQGDYDSAIGDFDEVIHLRPEDVAAYDRRGAAWSFKGEMERAAADFRSALGLDPKYISANNNLAWLLATTPEAKYRDGRQAVEYASAACEATQWKRGNFLDTLAAAYAEGGDFARAVQWQEKALKDPLYFGDNGTEFRQRLALYQQQRPYREDPRTVPLMRVAIKNYELALAQSAIRFAKYPPGTMELGWEGSAVLEAHIDASGVMLGVDLLQSTGHGALDAEAMAALRKAKPFTTLPQILVGKPFMARVRMVFTLKRGAAP